MGMSRRCAVFCLLLILEQCLCNNNQSLHRAGALESQHAQAMNASIALGGQKAANETASGSNEVKAKSAVVEAPATVAFPTLGMGNQSVPTVKLAMKDPMLPSVIEMLGAGMYHSGGMQEGGMCIEDEDCAPVPGKGKAWCVNCKCSGIRPLPGASQPNCGGAEGMDVVCGYNELKMFKHDGELVEDDKCYESSTDKKECDLLRETPKECAEMCISVGGCKSFVWANHMGQKKCWLSKSVELVENTYETATEPSFTGTKGCIVECPPPGLNGLGDNGHESRTPAVGAVYSMGKAIAGKLGQGNFTDDLKLPKQIKDKLVETPPTGGVPRDAPTAPPAAAPAPATSFLEAGLGEGAAEASATPADTLAQVNQVAAGLEFSMALQGGDVYTWGNGMGLGYKTFKPQTKPTKIPELDEVDVVGIAAGDAHGVAWTNDGKVFTWGSNKDGQLGRLTESPDGELKPQQVDSLNGKVVVDVKCRTGNCIAYTILGRVYTWGASLQNYTKQAWNETKQLQMPKLWHFFDGRGVSRISAGQEHFMVATSLNEVYTWGSSGFGQLGHGNFKDEANPKQVMALVGKNIVKVICGAYNSFIIDDQGRVFSWGDGKMGKIAHTKPFSAWLPKKAHLGTCDSIIDVLPGGLTTYFVTSFGDILQSGGDIWTTEMMIKPKPLVISTQQLAYGGGAAGFVHLLLIGGPRAW